MTRTLINPKNNASLESTLSVEQVREALAKINSDFSDSLLRKSFTRRGWSESQEFWAHKLALDSMTETSERDRYNVTEYDSCTPYINLDALFAFAGERLKYPRVTLHVADNCVITVKRVGAKSRNHEGDFSVSINGNWVGYLVADGELWTKRSANLHPAVFRALELFFAAPADFIAVCGRRSGRCCYCNTKLTDQRSIDCGYGPTCAGNYGQPWPLPAIKITADDVAIDWRPDEMLPEDYYTV